MVTAFTKNDEISKAEVEAWHKIHYRSEWFVERTFAYAVLLSALATYFFWDATRWEGSSVGAKILCSLLWILLISAGLMLYDYRTRRTSETWENIGRRAHKHLILGASTFIIAVAFTWVIHFIANGVAGPQPAPQTFIANPGVGVPQLIPSVTVTKTKASPAPKKAPAKPAAKPGSATQKPAAKPTAAAQKKT
jgi:hypothetical protein